MVEAAGSRQGPAAFWEEGRLRRFARIDGRMADRTFCPEFVETVAAPAA